MFRTCVVWSLAATLCVSNGLAEDELIKNWEAPAFWSPPARQDEPENPGMRTEAALAAMATSPLPFIGITPCRLLDTRNSLNPLGGGGPFAANEIRTYTLIGACGVLGSVGAVSLNVTATNTGAGAFGHIKIWPADQAEPNVSTLNYPGAGATVANAAIVPVSMFPPPGRVNVKSGNAPADVILDVNGYYSGTSSPTSLNLFLGTESGNSTLTGVLNTGIGFFALHNLTSGESNTAVGHALSSNTTGASNTALGDLALLSNTAGSRNTAVGASALLGTSGNDNVAVGYNALFDGAGTGNIAIGVGAGTNISTGSNNIYIGNAGSGNESGQIRIGTNGVHTQGTVIASIYGFNATGGAPVYVTSGGRLGTSTASSRRYKEEVHDIAAESDALLALRPVAFRYREEFDPARLPQYGLIAEEVAEVFPELVVCDREGRPESVRYHELSALLLNEIQKQHRSIESQRAEIESLEARLAKLEGRTSVEPHP